MKCPSKEIDKNNISLLLSKPQFLNSLFESQHSLCLFLLVVLWWFFFCFLLFFCCCFFAVHGGLMCLCRSKWGRLRDTPVCPQLSVPCPLRFSQAERLQVQSLPLRRWALTRSHIANPLLCFQPAALRNSQAWLQRSERASSGCNYLVAPVCPFPACLAVDTHWRSTWCTTTLLISSGSALDSVELSWPTRSPGSTGESSPQAPHCWESSFLIPPPSGGGVGVGSIEAGTKNERRKYISVPGLTVEHWGVVPRCQSLKAKTVSASRTLIKQKRKNFEDESASCVFSFSPVKTCFLLHGRELRASFSSLLFL